MKKLLIASAILLSSYFAFGQTWSVVGSGVDYMIYSLAVYNNNLYAGGEFTQAGGVPANSIAMWNGVSWNALGNGVQSEWYVNVNALQAYNNSLYAGGVFDTAGSVHANYIASWNGITWSAAGTGMNVYVAGGEPSVNAFDTINGVLFTGGGFDTAGGNVAKGIASWNGSAWSQVGTGVGGKSPIVSAIITYNGHVYAAGYFDSAGGVPAKSIAMWNGTTWMPLGSGFNWGGVLCLCVYKGLLIAGGEFDSVGGIAANNIAAWNGSNWMNLGTGIRYANSVCALAVYGGSLYAGGLFDSAGSIKANNIAQWDGSSWYTVGGGIGRFDDTNAVYALTVWNNALYVGGYFDSAGSIQANSIAKWTTPAGINEVSVDNSIIVYPNPSNGIFTIEEQGVRNKEQVEVYNMLGEKVYSTPLNLPQGGDFKIDLSDQSEGIYLYRIISEKGEAIATGS